MNRLSSRGLAATVLAAGLLLSACGQSDSSGRVRNSSLGEGCFATSAEKDNDVAFYERQTAEAQRLGTRIDELKKKQDELAAVYNSMLPQNGETWQSLYAKIDNTNQAEVDEWNTMMEAVHQANLAASAAAGEYARANNAYRNLPQYNDYLALVRQKPVCETPGDTNDTQVSEEPDTTDTTDTTETADTVVTTSEEPSVTETTDSTSNTTPVSSATYDFPEQCLNWLQITGGENQTIVVGETVELSFPLCAESSYIAVSGKNTQNAVYVNEIGEGAKRTAIIRLTGIKAGQDTYYFQQWDRKSKTSFPISTLNLTVIEPDVPPVCKDKMPDASMNADGILTATSTCDDADSVYVAIMHTDTYEVKASFYFYTDEINTFESVDMRSFLGNDPYVLQVSHWKWMRMGDSDELTHVSVGNANTIQFQLKTEKRVTSLPYDPLGIEEFPPVLFLEDSAPDDTSTDTQKKSDDVPAVSPAKIVMAPETRALSCSEACSDNVVKQSGVAPTNVETIEVSVNGSEWVALTPETMFPVLDQVNNVKIRVTPKDGSKPVVLTSTLYRDAAGLTDTSEVETIALSVGGEQTITAAPGRSGISPAQTILIALAVLILMVLAMLIMRGRRKPQA